MIGTVTPACFALYAAGFCWTIVYDTIYALQDIEHDPKSGIKSTALLFGQNVKPILALFATVSVVFFAIAGVVADVGVWYYTFSVGGVAMHYIWTICKLDAKSVKSAARLFVSSRGIGVLVAVGILVDRCVEFLL
jgi:4-hydroxybenzoate polyprenyltransferase